MSIKLMTQVWHQAPYKGERLLVLLALADWSNDEGECFPSYDQIALKARVTRRGAIKIVDQLIANEAISIEEEGSGKSRPNHYRLHPENWSKGEPYSPKDHRRKGASGSPFRRSKGEPDDTQRVNLKAPKGEPESNPPTPPYKEEPSINRHVEPSVEPTASPAATSGDDPIKIVIARYQELFVEKFGEKPNIHRGKDGKIIQGLYSRYGLEKLLYWLGRFFNSTDPFVIESGYTLGVFSTKLNSLIAQSKGSPQRQIPARTRENLAAVESFKRRHGQ
ncbi:MAG: helix-turn-helix domain-containing protein [Acidobacteriota bacterium]